MPILPFVEYANRLEKRTDRAIYETIFENNPLIAMLAVRDNPTLQEKWYTEGTLPQTQKRAANGTYTDTKATFQPNFLTFAYQGFTVSLDHQQALAPSTLDSKGELGLQMKQHLKAFRMDFASDVVNANIANDPKDTLGIKALIDIVDPIQDGVGSSEGEINLVYRGSANNDGVNFGDDPKIIITELNRLIAACNTHPTAIILDEWFIQQLFAIMLTKATNNVLANLFKPATATYTMNGRQYTYDYLTYRNIPLINPGTDSQNKKILDFNEKWGSSSVTTSIIAVVSSDTDFHIVQARKPVVVEKEGNELVTGRTLDYLRGFKYGSHRCIARMRGILQG